MKNMIGAMPALSVSSQMYNKTAINMKTQNNTTLIYVAPKVKTVAFSSRSHILSGSITPYEEGSHSDNNGEGIDME